MDSSVLITKFLFPGYHTIKNDGLWPIIKEYEKSQWYSHEKLKAIQENKLKRLLIHSMHNVPYYKQLFKEYGLFDIIQSVNLNIFSKIAIERLKIF